jgi:acetoacetyl-CoA synthetase
MAAVQIPDLHFEQLPFDHPLFIMYSSGTTGAPKCMVHSAGGCLIKHKQEHILQVCGRLVLRHGLVLFLIAAGLLFSWRGCAILLRLVRASPIALIL